MAKNNLDEIRHSLAHLLAAAVLKDFPKAKLGIGPVIENGFYYDFELPRSITPNDLKRFEKTMRELARKKLPFKGRKVTPAEARKIFKDQPFKLDLIKEFTKEKKDLTVYKTGDIFLDLCRGGHVKNTGEINVDAFKLSHLAGAYWRGSEKNPQLTRIYGLAFNDKKELNDYLQMIEKAKRRDHRKLGQELDLFSTNPLTGAGLILWHPKLSVSRSIVEQFWKDEHYANGYQLVHTPHIASMDMFVLSRHLSKYINSMFPVMLHEYIEGESAPDYQVDEVLKPMNCPNHIQIYKSRKRSYRELPMRLGELGTVYRYERAGVLHGMTRVRGFTQDDSHIFCTPDQVIDEVKGVLRLTQHFYVDVFGFKDYQAYLATRPEKYLGTPKMWSFAEKSLKRALEEENIPYKVDEGEGVFYGPKIDIKVKDSLGREWQLGTVQFDFNQPAKAETTKEEVDEFWALKTFKHKFKTKANLTKYLKRLGRGFDIKYVSKNGEEKQAVMIHRVVLGSMERFFGILIEHYAGNFPVWLAPVQVHLLPVSEKFNKYAKEVAEKLRSEGIRLEIPDSNETLGKRIREAEIQKVPYILVVGEKETKDKTVNVRERHKKETKTIKTEVFLKKVKKEIAERK